MTDLISRQAALEIVFDFAEAPHNMYEKIRQLPTAEPKKGKWIYKTMPVKGGKGQTYGKWQCSCCKKKEPRRRGYCPNCGARMESE